MQNKVKIILILLICPIMQIHAAELNFCADLLPDTNLIKKDTVVSGWLDNYKLNCEDSLVKLPPKLQSAFSSTVHMAISNPGPYQIQSGNGPVIETGGDAKSEFLKLPIGFQFNYSNLAVYGLNTNNFYFYLDVQKLKQDVKQQTLLDSLQKLQYLDSLKREQNQALKIIQSCRQRIHEDSIRIVRLNPGQISDSKSVGYYFQNHTLEIARHAGEFHQSDSLTSKSDSLVFLALKYQSRMDSVNQVLHKAEKTDTQLDTLIVNAKKRRLPGQPDEGFPEFKKPKKSFDFSKFNLLEIGRVTPEQSEILVNSSQLYGLSTSYESNNIISGLAIGKQLRMNQYEYLTSKQNQFFSFPAASGLFKSPKETFNDFVLVKGGIGSEQGDHIMVYATYVKGNQVGYQSYNYGQKWLNNGVEVEVAQTIRKGSRLTVAASTSRTQETHSGDQSTEKNSLGKNYGVSATVEHEFSESQISIKGNVRYISPEYNSFANVYLIRDQLRYQFSATKNFNSVVALTGGIEREARNVSNPQFPQIILTRYRAALRVKLWKSGYVNYSFYPQEYLVEGLNSKNDRQNIYNHQFGFTSGFGIKGIKYLANAYGGVLFLPAFSSASEKIVTNTSIGLSQLVSNSCTIEYRSAYFKVEDERDVSEFLEFGLGTKLKINSELNGSFLINSRVTNQNWNLLPAASINYQFIKKISVFAAVNAINGYLNESPAEGNEYNTIYYVCKIGANYTFNP